MAASDAHDSLLDCRTPVSGARRAEPINDWQIYFFDHNREIFLLLALLFPIDLVDTTLKGWEHFRAQGPVYPAIMIGSCIVCVIAAFTKNRRFHVWFAVLFLIYNFAFAGAQLITAQDAPGAGLLRSK